MKCLCMCNVWQVLRPYYWFRQHLQDAHRLCNTIKSSKNSHLKMFMQTNCYRLYRVTGIHLFYLHTSIFLGHSLDNMITERSNHGCDICRHMITFIIEHAIYYAYVMLHTYADVIYTLTT